MSDELINRERQAILEILEAHEVQFIVIGGAAAQTHGWRGDTQDLDVTPARDERNLERLAHALTELGARFRVAGYEQKGFVPPGGIDARTLRGQVSLAFVTKHGLIDVALIPDGTGGYEQLAEEAEAARVAQTTLTLLVASKSDILASKEAANRVKDREQLPSIREDFEREHGSA